MRCAFHQPNEAFWHSAFVQQGGQVPFRGFRYQRGAGLGNVLSSLFRFILPVAKSAGKAIGLQALETGGQLAADLASGQSFKTAVKKRGKIAAKKLIGQAVKRVQRKIQTGKGLGIRGRNKDAIKGVQSRRKPFKRRQRRDALGTF